MAIPSIWPARLVGWWPLTLGILALYLPTFYDLATGLWSSEAYAHGPIIFGLSLWLLARKWQSLPALTGGPRHASIGWFLFLSGQFLYIVGRSQSILMFEIGSFIIQLIAVLLITHGGRALKELWFPFFFMCFMVPLPGTLVDALTMPMKTAVSYMTEQFLFFTGYPIARSGVVLQIGQYQLLVADACAGLQTLLTLEALGLFYLNVVQHKSPFRNASLAFLIIPISFTANVIRVTALTLITYYFGDATGQGFLHGFAGIVLFLSALVLIITADSILQWAINKNSSKRMDPPKIVT